jgi:hypothetical protein
MFALRSPGRACALALAVILATSSFGCSTAAEGDVEAVESPLLSFPEGAFSNAAPIQFGESKSMDVAAAGLAVFRFQGEANDTVSLAVTQGDTFLVERRNGRFVPVLGTPLTGAATLTARLSSTQDYFIVVRNRWSWTARVSARLDRVRQCQGASRTYAAHELARRVPPGQRALFIEGMRYAANSARRVSAQVDLGTTLVDLGNVVPGVRVDLATARVMGTPDLVNRTHVEVTADCVGIEVDGVSFSGVIPQEMALPSTPPALPPFPCESQPTLVDDWDLLARFPRGSEHAPIGAAGLLWAEWRCSSGSGCVTRSGAEERNTVYGGISVDRNTQVFSIRIWRKRDNVLEGPFMVPVTRGTFAWNGYQGRFTAQHVVFTKTEAWSSSANGVMQSGEYRSGYCATW